MTRGYETTLEPEQGSKRGNANPAYTEDAAHVLLQALNSDGSQVLSALIDQFFSSLVIIDHEHERVHLGEMYTTGQRFSLAATGGIKEFLIVTPVDVFAHFRNFSVSSSGNPFNVDLFEGSTYSAIGTPFTANNNNRNSSNTHDALLYDTPTITADGLLIEPVTIHGASKQSGALGTEASNEWLLADDEVYLIRVTNNSAQLETFTMNMFFYEQ